MSVQKVASLTREKLKIMVRLMEITNTDFRNQSYEVMAQQISEEFDAKEKKVYKSVSKRFAQQERKIERVC